MRGYRSVSRVMPSHATRDGAGVNIRRVSGIDELDPFLLLDEFGSDDPDDYIAGFPEHPHRGFETVTYMLDGCMEHRDSVGNHGRLGPGDVQWMTAGRGILHSEMPLQENGLMRGFQLWINLPASAKLVPPRYQEFAAAAIPAVVYGGVHVKVIAGAHRQTAGAVQGVVTDPVYLDVTLEPGAVFEQPLADTHTALLYLYEGTASVGSADVGTPLATSNAAVLGESGTVAVEGTGEAPARFLLLAGRPLREPVVQHGPFVMNTREEIEQALDDYRNGRLAS